MDPAPGKSELRRLRRALKAENDRWPECMREVPMTGWSEGMKALAVNLTAKAVPMRAWRSRRFAAVLFDEGVRVPNRLSVNRAELSAAGNFVDGITWDELMQVKRECGFGKRDALELFPADTTVVNDANMRHLWILDTPSRLNWNR